MKNILVTGGTGFIGGHLVTKLLEDPDNRIFISDHRVLDLTIPNQFPDERIDEIYHLASVIGSKEIVNDPYTQLMHNLSMMANVIGIAKKCGAKKVVFVSTIEVNYLPKEITPRFMYAYSKNVCENMLIYSGLDYAIVRLPTVYGPGMKQGVIKDFIERNGELFIVNQANATRVFLYVEDAVKGLIEIMNDTSDEDEHIYSVGSPKPITIGKLAKIVAKVTKKKVEFDFRNVLYPEKRESRGNFVALKETPLEEGIIKTYESIRT